MRLRGARPCAPVRDACSREPAPCRTGAVFHPPSGRALALAERHGALGSNRHEQNGPEAARQWPEDGASASPEVGYKCVRATRQVNESSMRTGREPGRKPGRKTGEIQGDHG